MTSKNEIEIVIAVPLDRNATLKHLYENSGVSYDWWRTLGYPLRRWIRSGRKGFWNCVEFAESCAQTNGFSIAGFDNISPDIFKKRLETYAGYGLIK